MPKVLREWEAYHELKKEIDDFSEVLPLLMELGKKWIMTCSGGGDGADGEGAACGERLLQAADP